MGLTHLLCKVETGSLYAGNRGPRKKERYTEPQLNWDEAPSRRKWPHGMGWPERVRNSKVKSVRKLKDPSNSKQIQLDAEFSNKMKS